MLVPRAVLPATSCLKNLGLLTARFPSAWNDVPVASQYAFASSTNWDSVNMETSIPEFNPDVKPEDAPLADIFPQWHYNAMSPWDRDLIAERANARAREIFGKAASTRFKECGLSEDLLAGRKKTDVAGIGLKTLEKAANCLRWTVPQLMGIETGVDKEKLRIATKLIERLMEDYPADKRELLIDQMPDWIEAAYGIVCQLSIENPESWNSPESFTAMSSTFVRLMRLARARSTS